MNGPEMNGPELTGPQNPSSNLPQRDAHLAQRNAHLIQITDAAFASAAARSGPHLVCHPGCTQCCHGAFAIHALDAWRLRQGMQQLTLHDPERARAVAQRANAYVEEFTASFPGNPITGLLGDSEEDQAAFEDFANEAACPALDPATGLCDLYEARPMTCRTFGPPVRSYGEAAESSEAEDSGEAEEGLAICELCFTTATQAEIAAAEMTPPCEEEASLLEALLESLPAGDQSAPSQTIIAWCLATQPAPRNPEAIAS
jgi:Fe-S-cluster containining protein